jgi:hypothetical protein
MKKMIGTLLALSLVLAVAMTAALAEDSPTPILIDGVEFNMDMDQVMQLVNRSNPEIDSEQTRGGVEFMELEYAHVSDPDGFAADIKFLFVGNSLVAIHYDMADGTSYDNVRTTLANTYGEAVPFDASKIGSGRYAVDDDGDLKDCQEMIEAGNLIIVLEHDNDGDVDVTFLDMGAAYINS